MRPQSPWKMGWHASNGLFHCPPSRWPLQLLRRSNSIDNWSLFWCNKSHVCVILGWDFDLQCYHSWRCLRSCCGDCFLVEQELQTWEAWMDLQWGFQGIVLSIGENSLVEIRERKSARKCAVFGEAGEILRYLRFWNRVYRAAALCCSSALFLSHFSRLIWGFFWTNYFEKTSGITLSSFVCMRLQKVPCVLSSQHSHLTV